MSLPRYTIIFLALFIFVAYACKYESKAPTQEIRGNTCKWQAKQYLDSLYSLVLPVSMHGIDLHVIHVYPFIDKVDKIDEGKYGLNKIIQSRTIECIESNVEINSDKEFVLQHKGYDPYEAGPMIYFSEKKCHILYAEVRNSIFDGKMAMGGGEVFLFLFDQQNQLDTVYQTKMSFN